MWYEVADAVTRYAGRSQARRAAVALGRHGTPPVVHALSEGVALARYRFDRYRSSPSPSRPATLAVLVPTRDSARRCWCRTCVT